MKHGTQMERTWT